MLNISIVSFYNNFGLIFKGSEGMATKGIQNCPLLNTPWLINASWCKNPNEYP